MEKVIQNSVANLIDYYPAKAGEVAKYPIFSNSNGKSMLLVFDAQTSLPRHEAPADATVLVVDGEVKFDIENMRLRLHRGDIITMKKGTPHSVSVTQSGRILLSLYGE